MNPSVATLARKGVKVLNPRRLPRNMNQVLNWLELYRLRTRLVSSPPIIQIATSTLCNLKCPFCPTGNGSLELRRELLKPAVFERIMANCRVDRFKIALLYNWGEPLLNPNLCDFIRFFSERRIYTIISTNLSVADHSEAFLEELIRSGLGELMVSIDGATQASYETYRVGGRLERVTGNMDRLAAVKKRLKLERPRVIFRMLLNRFNEQEVDAARAMAAAHGAEFFLDENMYIPLDRYEQWGATRVKEAYGTVPATMHGRRRRRLIHTECRQLWDTLVVNVNGDVYPCCIAHQPPVAVGNLLEEPQERIWNGPKMQSLRRFAIDAASAAPSFPNICESCGHRYCIHGIR